MNFNFYAEDVNLPEFDNDKIVATLNFILKTSPKSLDYINFIFCSDSYLLDINVNYLSHDYYTDIITFDYSEEQIQSDIYISTERVFENSKLHEVDFLNELYRILIHGVLHLVGFKDKTDEEKNVMTQKENFYLSKII